MDIYSKIDSDRFGFKIGKIDETFFENNEIYDFIKWKYDLILARISIKNIEQINLLEKYGFTVKDIQHTYYFKNDDKILNIKRDDSYIVRKFKESDTPRLIELARICFDNYGHYFNDDRLNHADCLDAYGDWAYNSCINKNVADEIFVSEKDGEIAGYLSFKIKEDNGKKYGVGGMGAVDPKHRGKGVFQDITISGLKWGLDNNLDWEEHNTLVDNTSVNRSFTNVGFKPKNVVVTLHGWMDEIKDLK